MWLVKDLTTFSQSSSIAGQHYRSGATCQSRNRTISESISDIPLRQLIPASKFRSISLDLCSSALHIVCLLSLYLRCKLACRVTSALLWPMATQALPSVSCSLPMTRSRRSLVASSHYPSTIKLRNAKNLRISESKLPHNGREE